MPNESRRRVRMLQKLNSDMRNQVVSLEVFPRDNKPDHIMKGTPLKSWLHYVLKVGQWSAEGKDFDQLVDRAYSQLKIERGL